MDLIPLSRIMYKDKEYLIFINQKGIRSFYLIDNDELRKVNAKTNIELSKIFNQLFDGRLYMTDKTAKRIAIASSVVLGSVLIYGLHEFCKLYVDDRLPYFIEQDNIIWSSYNDIIKYVEEDDDELGNILRANDGIKSEYHLLIREFVNRYKDEEDMKLFYYNLKDLRIGILKDIKLKEKYGYSCCGYYDILENQITLSDELDFKTDEGKEILFHELRHACKSTSLRIQNKLYYNTFNVVRDELTYGTAFLEGMNARYTDDICDEIISYPVQQIHIEALIKILGEDKLKEIESYGNSDILCEELAKITATKEASKRLLLLMDDELKTSQYDLELSKDTRLEIKRILSSYFLAKEQQELLNCDDSDYIKNYLKYLDDCSEFKSLFGDYLKINIRLYDTTQAQEEYDIMTEWFDEAVELYSKEFVEKYSIDSEKVKELNTWVFIKEDDTTYPKTNYLKSKPAENNTNILCMKKAYLVYGNKEELLNYMTDEELNNILDEMNEKQR